MIIEDVDRRWGPRRWGIRQHPQDVSGWQRTGVSGAKAVDCQSSGCAFQRTLSMNQQRLGAGGSDRWRRGPEQCGCGAAAVVMLKDSRGTSYSESGVSPAVWPWQPHAPTPPGPGTRTRPRSWHHHQHVDPKLCELLKSRACANLNVLDTAATNLPSSSSWSELSCDPRSSSVQRGPAVTSRRRHQTP